MAVHKQKWSIGDVFVIPTEDGKHVVGQLIGREAEVLNSVTVALFDERVDRPEDAARAELPESKVFSVLFATRDLLDSGDWRVVTNRPVEIPRRWFPSEDKRASGFVGAKVIGSGIINEFVNAYFCLVPWDDWKDLNYLDNLLLSPEKKPKNVILKSTMS